MCCVRSTTRLRYPAKAKLLQDQMPLLGLRFISPSRCWGSWVRAALHVAVEGMSQIPRSSVLGVAELRNAFCLGKGAAGKSLDAVLQPQRGCACSSSSAEGSGTGPVLSGDWQTSERRLSSVGWGYRREEGPSCWRWVPSTSARLPGRGNSEHGSPFSLARSPYKSPSGEASPAVWL